MTPTQRTDRVSGHWLGWSEAFGSICLVALAHCGTGEAPPAEANRVGGDDVAYATDGLPVDEPAETDLPGGDTGDAGDSCLAGTPCVENPGAPCRMGLLSCVGGSHCVDGEAAPMGLSCGADRVCDGAGGCLATDALRPLLTVTRPLQSEILAVTRTALPFDMRLGGEQRRRISVQIRDDDEVLYATTVQVDPGPNSFTLPLVTEVAGRRTGRFFELVVGDVVVRSFGLGFLFVAAGQSNTVSAECNQCPTTVAPVANVVDHRQGTLSDLPQPDSTS